MTSANVTHYKVYKGKSLRFELRQNCMCKMKYKDGLAKDYATNGDGLLLLVWPDEYGIPHYSKPMRLKSFINGAKIKW